MVWSILKWTFILAGSAAIVAVVLFVAFIAFLLATGYSPD